MYAVARRYAQSLPRNGPCHTIVRNRYGSALRNDAQQVVQKGPGRQGSGLEVPQSAAHECFTLGARGFPFCPTSADG